MCGCAVVALLAGCGGEQPPDTRALTADPKPATSFTRAANEAVKARLPFSNTRDFELATRGRLAGPETLVIPADSGGAAWDMSTFDFIAGDAPDTVNPSLWRQAQLNKLHGLFEVVDGIYQVRGYDLSNVTFVRGKTGWIVIDPLITVETARAALALVDETLGARPVRAMIFSHSGAGGIHRARGQRERHGRQCHDAARDLHVRRSAAAGPPGPCRQRTRQTDFPRTHDAARTYLDRQ